MIGRGFSTSDVNAESGILGRGHGPGKRPGTQTCTSCVEL